MLTNSSIHRVILFQIGLGIVAGSISRHVNPRVVQQRLGHSDVQITLNTYTHVLPEMDAEAAEKIDNIILKKA